MNIEHVHQLCMFVRDVTERSPLIGVEEACLEEDLDAISKGYGAVATLTAAAQDTCVRVTVSYEDEDDTKVVMHAELVHSLQGVLASKVVDYRSQADVITVTNWLS